MPFIIVVDFLFSKSYYSRNFIFNSQRKCLYSHKILDCCNYENLYPRIVFLLCGCINQYMRNLVPAKICTFKSILRPDHNLRLLLVSFEGGEWWSKILLFHIYFPQNNHFPSSLKYECEIVFSVFLSLDENLMKS